MFEYQKAYAGIGSRNTPPHIIEKMIKDATTMATKGFVLHSGGADGADDAFERGCISANGSMEIYLPTTKFNGRVAGDSYINAEELSTYKRAYEIAREYHPNWKALSAFGKKLMTRNVFQVLGMNLRSPVEIVLCWTPDGSIGKTTQRTGGTGQALRIAFDKGIEIYNYGKIV